jgi:hypothetical protein
MEGNVVRREMWVREGMNIKILGEIFWYSRLGFF